MQLTNLTRLGLVKVPKDVGLNDVQASFLGFSYQRFPHLPAPPLFFFFFFFLYNNNNLNKYFKVLFLALV